MSDTKKKHLLEFLNSQKLLVIATADGGKPWISNVYYSIDDDFNLFFVSPPETKHSQHIAQNSQVAFSVTWYDEKDLVNRKAIQGTGECTRVTNPKEIVRFLKNHHSAYPLWENKITYLNMKNKIIGSRPYVIKPSHVKFWNDELYGENETQEFTF